jgi:hypothetical protein
MLQILAWVFNLQSKWWQHAAHPRASEDPWESRERSQPLRTYKGPLALCCAYVCADADCVCVQAQASDPALCLLERADYLECISRDKLVRCLLQQ